ncbi:MAG: metalloregulator ArsR/SmtB family transcription factor [Eubacteriales bacterium]
MVDCSDVAIVFKALCDETRVSIIQFLGDGERCACDISEALNIAQSKLSYHMKILCESGLVESWYVGKWTHYQISEVGSKTAITLLQELTGVDAITEEKAI